MAAPNERAGLLPAVGALLLTLFAVGGSVGFLAFQGKEQERFLAAKSARCQSGATDACDVLQSLCVKRDPDACIALADASLSPGPSHDPREGARLLGEACLYRHPRACARGGRIALEGGKTPEDLVRAKQLLERGCAIGDKEACALRQTVP
jgi:TPR repeat protein